MNLVMMKPPTFWNNGNLVNCFVETLGHLISGLETGFIGDVFFPKVGHFFSWLPRLYIAVARSIFWIESRISKWFPTWWDTWERGWEDTNRPTTSWTSSIELYIFWIFFDPDKHKNIFYQDTKYPKSVMINNSISDQYNEVLTFNRKRNYQ